MAEPFRRRADGIDLIVRLTPKSAADGRCHVKARVRAVPEKGAANSALEKLVAKALGVPSSSVTVVAGGTARLKTLRITGDPAELARRASDLGAP